MKQHYKNVSCTCGKTTLTFILINHSEEDINIATAMTKCPTCGDAVRASSTERIDSFTLDDVEINKRNTLIS